MNMFQSALQVKSRQIKKAVEKRPPPLNQLRLQLELTDSQLCESDAGPFRLQQRLSFFYHSLA